MPFAVDWIEILLLAALGAAAGFAAGLMGIGGGMLMVPFLTMLFAARGFPPEHLVHIAIATSLATILFTSVSSVRAHHRRGAVRWDIVKTLAPGIMAGSLIGAQFAGALPTRWLALVFALIIGVAATRMVFASPPQPGRDLPGPLALFGVGNAIGVVSSLAGAGGGFLSVPFMVRCNVAIRNAVATSAALGFPIAAAGAVGYVIAGLREQGLPAGTIGFIHVPALLSIAAASVLTAPLGARVSHQLGTQKLTRVFAAMLYGLAAYMLTKAVRA